MQSLVTGALMSAVSAIGNGTGPVRVPETRIVVAPFCGVSSRNAEQSRTLVDEIGRYCNAIYYAPWLFLERRPSHVVAPNEYGRSELSLRSPILAGALENAEVCLRGGGKIRVDLQRAITEKRSAFGWRRSARKALREVIVSPQFRVEEIE